MSNQGPRREARWRVYAILVSGILQSIAKRFARPASLALQSGLVVLAVVAFQSPADILALPANADEQAHRAGQQTRRVAFANLCEFIDGPDGPGEAPRRVLIHIGKGPEILYRTKHSVFSIPSHRYHAGFMDSYRIFEATEDEDALVWVRKRGVELIIVDREARGSLYRRDSRGRGRQQAILYQRLQRGRIADWLDRVRLPKEIRSRFGVFSVKALP